MNMSFFFPAIFTLLSFDLPVQPVHLDCPEPTNVQVVAETGSSITFDWDDCGCATPTYQVYYKRGSYTSAEYTTTDSRFTFSGLSAGNYSFFFYTVCGAEASSMIIIVDTMEG